MDQKIKLTSSIILNFILLLTLFYFYSSTTETSLAVKPENQSKTTTFHESKLCDKISSEINAESPVPTSSQHATETPLKSNNSPLAQQNNMPMSYERILEIEKEFIETRDKAYGYFMKIRDFPGAFENDEYDAEWSSKMTNDINDSVLFDAEKGVNRFPAIAVDDLECRGSLCKIDFQHISGNVADWDTQRSELRDKLMRLGGSENQWDRAVKTSWLEDGRIRYYISKGVSELEPPLD